MRWIIQVNSCCYCWSLLTGCCIIGHLEAICGIATIVQDLLVLEDSPEQDSAVMYYAFLSDLLLSSIQTITGIMLVFGVKTNTKDQVRVWIQVHVFLFAVVILGYVLSVVVIPFTNEMVNVAIFEMYILLYTIRSLVLYGICIIVVNSYYMQNEAWHKGTQFLDSES